MKIDFYDFQIMQRNKNTEKIYLSKQFKENIKNIPQPIQQELYKFIVNISNQILTESKLKIGTNVNISIYKEINGVFKHVMYILVKNIENKVYLSHEMHFMPGKADSDKQYVARLTTLLKKNGINVNEETIPPTKNASSSSFCIELDLETLKIANNDFINF